MSTGRTKFWIFTLAHCFDLMESFPLTSSVLRETGGEVSVAQLRWGEVEDMEKVGREFDLVLAADVVYYEYLYEPLLRTLRWLFEGKQTEEMAFVMGHLRRWKKDNVFFRKARKWFNVEVLWIDRGSCQGSRSGVVVYRFDCKGNKFNGESAKPSPLSFFHGSPVGMESSTLN